MTEYLANKPSKLSKKWSWWKNNLKAETSLVMLIISIIGIFSYFPMSKLTENDGFLEIGLWGFLFMFSLAMLFLIFTTMKEEDRLGEAIVSFISANIIFGVVIIGMVGIIYLLGIVTAWVLF